MDTELLINQAMGWLAEGEARMRIEVLTDLPDLNWIAVKKMSEREDLLNIEYQAPGLFAMVDKTMVEMTCSRSAIKAVRRQKEAKVGEFLDDVFGAC